ncbi:MAG TPA: coenzyme F420-0:L-glutamate ligase [Patescibacteria group bacterium]|nr:coenzyme F420-0:L-glutamate ligase [Patescibacteria group bacterium]
MNIRAIKTGKIVPNHEKLTTILDKYISDFNERSVLVITSKIVSICEGRVIKKDNKKKNDLIPQEADYYVPPSKSKYDVTLTIKNNLLIPSAGIDESNGNGYFILWPKNPQRTVNEIRSYLVKRFKLTKVGVIISDSKTTPLRWGTTGTALVHSGFSALNDYIGKPDIFGRLLTMTKVNVMDALAGAAVLVMGESNEQTPLAIITDTPFVQFQKRNPTKKELNNLHIDMSDDVYAPLLTSVKWEKKR